MYTYPLMEPQPFARGMQDDMIAELEREPPRIMILVNVDASWLRRPESDTRLMRCVTASAKCESCRRR